MKIKAIRVLGLLALILSIVGVPAYPASAAPSQTGQSIMVNLDAAGQFFITEDRTYNLNIEVEGVADANGTELPGKDYFTNTLTSGPEITQTSGRPGAGAPPPTPAAPPPDAEKVTKHANGGAVWDQWETFLDGGTLTGFTYNQSVVADGTNRTKWTFTWTYTVAPNPDPDRDADPETPGVQVIPLTAWVLVSIEGGGLADIIVDAVIAGESAVSSSNAKVGTKYSFSLNPVYDETGAEISSRVQDLTLTVNDGSSDILTLYPGSMVVMNTPGSTATATSTIGEVIYGDDGALDFFYQSNAGWNGNTGLLRDGEDARTILNNDSFAGNQDGGADGSALALAKMDSTTLSLGPGSYTITFTGTVKDNSGVTGIDFTVTQSIVIHTPRNAYTP